MKKRHAEIELDWGDGTYSFRLGLGEIEELERKCALGVFQIVTRLHPDIRQCRSGEIFEVIRLGLIGGGMQAVQALTMARKYMDSEPLDANRDVAYAITLAGLMRLHGKDMEDEAPPGKTKARKTTRGSTSSPLPEPPR